MSIQEIVEEELQKAFCTGKPQGSPDEYPLLARAILEKGIEVSRNADLYPNPRGMSIRSLDDLCKQHPEACKKDNDKERVRLKVYAYAYLGNREQGRQFTFEEQCGAEFPDLLSEDGNIWVECGASHPLKVIRALRRGRGWKFTLFKKPEGRTIQIWDFLRGANFDIFNKRFEEMQDRLCGKPKVERKIKRIAIQCQVRGPGCLGMIADAGHYGMRRKACAVCRKKGHKPIRWIPKEDQEKMLDAAKSDPKWYALLSLVFETGLERKYLPHVKISDVLKGEKIGDRLRFVDKGMGVELCCYISLDCRRALERYFNWIGEQSGELKPETRLFPLGPTAISSRFERLQDRLSIDDRYTLNDVRHTVALRLVRDIDKDDLIDTFRNVLGNKGNRINEYMGLLKSTPRLRDTI